MAICIAARFKKDLLFGDVAISIYVTDRRLPAIYAMCWVCRIGSRCKRGTTSEYKGGDGGFKYCKRNAHTSAPQERTTDFGISKQRLTRVGETVGALNKDIAFVSNIKCLAGILFNHQD